MAKYCDADFKIGKGITLIDFAFLQAQDFKDFIKMLIFICKQVD